jgi:uncharacterized protein
MLVGLIAIAFPFSLWANEQSTLRRSISTSGEAIVYVVPDEVIVTLGVQTSDASLDKAKSGNDEASQRLIAAIKAQGIEDKHVATDNVQVTLRYANDDRTISAYVVTRMYMATIKDTKRLEALVDEALKNGANRLDGVEFRSTELRKHRDKARSMAIKAAKEKASALAKELECGVGMPSGISESSNHWGWGWGRGMTSNFNSQNIAQSAPASVSESGESLPLGQIAVHANVSVTFDLKPDEQSKSGDL